MFISLSHTDGETSDLILTETVVFISSYHHRWVVICLLFTLEAVPRLHLCSLECAIQWIIRKKCFGAVLCWWHVSVRVCFYVSLMCLWLLFCVNWYLKYGFIWKWLLVIWEEKKHNPPILLQICNPGDFSRWSHVNCVSFCLTKLHACIIRCWITKKSLLLK